MQGKGHLKIRISSKNQNKQFFSPNCTQLDLSSVPVWLVCGGTSTATALRPSQPWLALTRPLRPPPACGPGPHCRPAWALLPAPARPGDAGLQRHRCPGLALAPHDHREPSWGPGLWLTPAAILGPALLPHSVQWGSAQRGPLGSQLSSCVRWTAGWGH